MQTNLGTSPTNFTKPKTVNYTSGTTILSEDTSNLNLSDVSNQVLKVIASLNKDQSEVDLSKDKNPLDNIIVNEVVTLFSYKKISKSIINAALDKLANGQDPNGLFSVEQDILILNQARDLEYISEAVYLDQIKSPTAFYLNHPKEYLKLLTFQLSLPDVVPTTDELLSSGIVDLIIQTILNNPDVIINEALVQQYTENYIEKTLLLSEFIGYENCQKIYNDPFKILNILDAEVLENFLYRVKTYLNFITEDQIKTILKYLPSQYSNISTIFSESQIRLMVDKELDIKNLILKTLTLEEVIKTFNELAAKFKLDFTEAFTNEKLMELIEITINKMFPELTINQIYQNIAKTYNITITEDKINKIEAYLASY